MLNAMENIPMLNSSGLPLSCINFAGNIFFRSKENNTFFQVKFWVDAERVRKCQIVFVYDQSARRMVYSPLNDVQ